jgi:hypothetical protein
LRGIINLTILQEKQGTLARRSCGWASLAGKVDPGTAQTVHRSRAAVNRNLLEAAPPETLAGDSPAVTSSAFRADDLRRLAVNSMLHRVKAALVA